MKKKRNEEEDHTHTHIALIAVLLSAALAQAEVKSFMIPLSSQLYDMADALYAMAGQAKPATSRPWSYSEARNILDLLDETRLPEGAAALYDDALAELEENQPRWTFDEGTVGFSARAELSPEVYVHTNEAFNLDEDQLKGKYDWYLTYNERQKFLNVDLDFSASPFFYGFMNAFVAKRRYTDPVYYTVGENAEVQHGVGANGLAGVGTDDSGEGTDGGSGWPGNQTLVKSSSAYQNIFNINIGALSMEFPDRAFGAFGGDTWYLTIGRERYNWGDSHISNLLIDDSLDYHDAARFAVFSKNNVFRYEVLFSFFDGYPLGNVTDKNGAEKDKYFKMFMGHRFDIRPLRWLSFSITENTMFHSRYTAGIYPQWLNPFYFFHNMNMRNSWNSMLWLEANVAPVRGLNMYGQFALDQAQTPTETGDGGSDVAAWGAILGAEYTHTLGRGYFTTSLEGAYTTPWLYRRDKTDFIVWTRETSPAVKVYYLGFSYGGDAVVANADVWYTMPGSFKAGFVWTGLIHGETDMTDPVHSGDSSNDSKTGNNPNQPRTAPYGQKLYQMMFTLAGEYEVPRFVKWMDVTARAGATLVLKNDRRDVGDGKACDFQFTAGATLKF